MNVHMSSIVLLVLFNVIWKNSSENWVVYLTQAPEEGSLPSFRLASSFLMRAWPLADVILPCSFSHSSSAKPSDQLKSCAWYEATRSLWILSNAPSSVRRPLTR